MPARRKERYIVCRNPNMTASNIPRRVVFVALLVGAIAGCDRQAAAPTSAAAASQPVDRTNATRANGTGPGPTVDDPVTRAASSTSAVTSSQTTGTQQAPGGVTPPPEGSPNSRGGPGPK
jgi:hypothetical protein